MTLVQMSRGKVHFADQQQLKPSGEKMKSTTILLLFIIRSYLTLPFTSNPLSVNLSGVNQAQ